MKRFIILAIALTVGLSACDVLDTKPLSQISPSAYFKTETDLQLFSNPFYNNLLDKSPYNKQSDLYIGQNLSEVMLGGNKRTVPNSGEGWTWTDLRRMNTLLVYVNQCEDENAIIKYTALTRFFRAYFYFDKVKRFGDVPWYEQELGSADESLYNPRDSRELVMTKMIEDIDYAIEYLPPAVSTYRVNRWAALALKARFCLYEGTFRKYHQLVLEGHDYTYYLEQSAKAAKELIDDGPYRLYSTGNPDKDYLTLFAQENASPEEYILAIKFDLGLQIYHNATAHTVVATQGRPGLTRKMVNTYLKTDGTAFTAQAGWQTKGFVEEVSDRDPRLAQSIRTPGYTRIGKTEVLPPDLGMTVTGYQPIKFVQDPTASGGNVDRNDRSTCDLPVFRYAEVLLNYAEAKAEMDALTPEDIKISVKLIRDRAGMPNLDMHAANAAPDWYLSSPEYGYTNVTGSNKGVILEIRRERAIELTQEGFRFNDLVRWKAGYCIDQELYGMYFGQAGEYDLTGDGVTDVILYESGTPKPSAPTGVQVYLIGEDIILSEGNRGYIDYHKNIERTKFSEVRDYLYPIPINERSLNRNLTQNPGWNDGLDF
jgi:hypothetical protein